MPLNPLWYIGASALSSALAARGAARAAPEATIQSLTPRQALAMTIGTNVASAIEARSNRRFQERMSSTAHQREVEDLKKAGLNPVMSAMGGPGASSPGGAMASFDNPASSALAARQMEANIDLTHAQAGLVRTQAADISNTAAAGRLRQISSQADIASLDAEQRRNLLPMAVERARAEIAQISSGARAQAARALLDELEQARGENVAQFERRVGEYGPAMRFLFELLRAISPKGVVR